MKQKFYFCLCIVIYADKIIIGLDRIFDINFFIKFYIYF